jgi:4-amino-4-deoxy-L-arabinose transferase-like glycosyltransferase
MNVPDKKLQVFFYILITLLLFPALFLNLGMMPISGDEGTRALVSLEMEYSGNLTTPTINGEFYFNKPPLYNWILLAFYKISHSHSEFIIRLPSVLSLLIFGLTVFLFLRKKIGEKAAFISSLAFVTCGRILFYDSLNGYIDFTFSLAVFLGFISVYHFYRRQQYYLLFLLSYMLAAMAFLMKGLPALLFQGITILTVFISGRNFKKLFSFSHFAGIVLFLLITGGYYFTAFRANPDQVYFSTLFSESAKRTFVEYGFLKTLQHIFTFPLDQLYHLFPWTILFVLLFNKKIIRKIMNDDLLKFLSFVFLFNIPVYWIAVESYPRYIFSLYPLLISICVIVYLKFSEDIPVHIKVAEVTGGVLIILLIPFSFLLPHFYGFVSLKKPYLPGLLSVLAVVPLSLAYCFLRKFRLEIIIVTLLVFRIGFDLIALPERHAVSRSVFQKNKAVAAGTITKGSPLYLTRFAPCSHETGFYLTSRNGDIVRRIQDPPVSGNYYIIDDHDAIKPNEEVILKFETRWNNSAIRLSKMN